MEYFSYGKSLIDLQTYSFGFNDNKKHKRGHINKMLVVLFPLRLK